MNLIKKGGALERFLAATSFTLTIAGLYMLAIFLFSGCVSLKSHKAAVEGLQRQLDGWSQTWQECHAAWESQGQELVDALEKIELLEQEKEAIHHLLGGQGNFTVPNIPPVGGELILLEDSRETK